MIVGEFFLIDGSFCNLARHFYNQNKLKDWQPVQSKLVPFKHAVINSLLGKKKGLLSENYEKTKNKLNLSSKI